MSNTRKPPRDNAYRECYLRSPAWFARRDRWFRDELLHTDRLGCVACGAEATRRMLELHHVDYSGVIRTDAGWHARELHTDLMALHPYCHELLHRLIDRDRVLARHRDRRAASLSALLRLRGKLRGHREAS
jgi:5-methylcytosine-specific restriction protein A